MCGWLNSRGRKTEGNSTFGRNTCRWTVILDRMWQEEEVHWFKSSALGLTPVAGCCEQSHGTCTSTMRGIYWMEAKGVCSVPRNDSAPCSQLKSWSALSSGVFIPLQSPTSPTHHTTFDILLTVHLNIFILILTNLMH